MGFVPSMRSLKTDQREVSALGASCPSGASSTGTGLPSFAAFAASRASVAGFLGPASAEWPLPRPLCSESACNSSPCQSQHQEIVSSVLYDIKE